MGLSHVRLGFREDPQELERKRVMEALSDRQQIFQRILASKSPLERPSLRRQLANQVDQMGERISKELSKLCLCWFRTACLDTEASLEFEDDTGEIAWNGIRVDTVQLTEWIVRRIIRAPIEQRLNMILKCSKYITFSEDQQQRLQASVFTS
jgi:hypothetical protein